MSFNLINYLFWNWKWSSTSITRSNQRIYKIEYIDYIEVSLSKLPGHHNRASGCSRQGSDGEVMHRGAGMTTDRGSDSEVHNIKLVVKTYPGTNPAPMAKDYVKNASMLRRYIETHLPLTNLRISCICKICFDERLASREDLSFVWP